MSYTPYDKDTASTEDRIAWALCQIIDDDAPLRWTRYRGAAVCIASNPELMADLHSLAADGETAVAPASFQQRVEPWLLACFGEAIAADTVERNHRFLEEALELVQACGCTISEAHQLVDYTYGRVIGEKRQEAGGVMVTLAALCRAQGIDMHAEGERELARIWTMVDKIRAKQAAKPKHSPLPE